MFDRFNDDARALIRLAQEQAGHLGHGWTGTEHLLLGIVAQGRSAAAEVLAEAGVDLQTLREDVVEVVGTGLSRGTELIRPEDEVALRSVGIDIEEVRARVEAVFGRGALTASPCRSSPPEVSAATSYGGGS